MTSPQTSPPAGRFDVIPLESITFGPGSSRDIASICNELDMHRIVVIASPSVAQILDVWAYLQTATGGRVVEVFTGGRPHVPHDAVLAATDATRKSAADGIISFGGGSAIDLAKAVSLCLAENVTTREELLRWRVVYKYPDTVSKPVSEAPKVPHLAISTTLSAGEFTPLAGVTDTIRQTKDIYTSRDLVPRAVVLDPELSVHTPRSLWASTGIKAVDHAIETICSISAQPLTDALATDALRRLTSNLPTSVADASDLDAAGQCQVGAWESIFGLTNVKLGLSHGIAHQLGGRNGVPHGIGSCVMLPAVLEFNAAHTQGAQKLIAEILSSATEHDVSLGAPELLRRFIGSLGLPTQLREVGVLKSDFALLAAHTVSDMIVSGNPRPVQGEADIVELLELAW